MIDQRQFAHELVDLLPQPQLLGLVEFLKTIVDPAQAALQQAPLEDEPISEDEQAGVEQAYQWIADHQGEAVSHAEAMRRLGLE